MAVSHATPLGQFRLEMRGDTFCGGAKLPLTLFENSGNYAGNKGQSEISPVNTTVLLQTVDGPSIP